MSQIRIRYESFDQFFRLNEEAFKKIQSAKGHLKSPQELGMSGNAIIEAERLGYYFLNLKNLVSDVLFAVGASVLDSKHDIKVQTAIVYRELKGSATDKKVALEADERVVNANKRYNDMDDLKEYLNKKYSDFESNYYYYRGLSQGNK